MVGGVIDTLSGLAGLIDIVAPGVGTAVSIGLDVLNAVLDAKSDQGVEKPKKNKLDILGDMTKSVGSWIWGKRMYIPILSSVNRFMMAWDDFKSGNIASGFGNFGLALSNLVTGVDGKVIMDGISGFMGLFESSGGSETAPKPNKSFISEMTDVISKKITELWEWVKQKIKDGIAGLIPGGKAALDLAGNAVKSTKELTGHITEKAKRAYDGVKSSYAEIDKTYKDFTKKGAVKLKSFTDNVWNYFKPVNLKKSPERSPKLKVLENAKETSIAIKNEKVSENLPTKSQSLNHPITNPDKQSNIPILLKNEGSGDSTKILYKLNVESNQYLKIIANNTALLVSKMTNGSGGGGGQTVIVSPPQQSQKTPSVSIDNNRMGFAASAYSLG